MLIRSIMLHNFRSFSKASFKFLSQTTVIVGPNTSGKTNLLEGIYLLGTGKSFRANVEQEMIKNASDFARVMGRVESGGEEKNLEVFLGREKNKLPRAESPRYSRPSGSTSLFTASLHQWVKNPRFSGSLNKKKKLAINHLAKRLVDYQGILRVVLFGPWDLNLITDSPSARRKFLDSVLSQVDREYRRSLLSYEKGLRSRNRLLEYIREGRANRSQLLFWDQLLIKNGDYIAGKREEFIEFVNSNYQLPSTIYQLGYDRSAISQARLAQYAEEEVAAGATLVGPHRDDIVFKIKNNRDLSVYGSRGEQRMCILWLKLAELAFIESVTRDRPVLLLDDIFSELDHRHREIVMQIIQKHQSPAPYAGQTIITTADPHTIATFKYKGERIKLA